MVETTGVDLGMGTTFAGWTYNGRIPRADHRNVSGRTVTLNVHHKGTTSHGLDTHAFKIDARTAPQGPWPTCTSRAAFTVR